MHNYTPPVQQPVLIASAKKHGHHSDSHKSSRHSGRKSPRMRYGRGRSSSVKQAPVVNKNVVEEQNNTSSTVNNPTYNTHNATNLDNGNTSTTTNNADNNNTNNFDPSNTVNSSGGTSNSSSLTQVDNTDKFLFQPITISNDARLQSAAGTVLPQSLSLYGNATYNEDFGYGGQIGFVYNLGGKARKLLVQEIEQQRLDNMARMCTNFVLDGVSVDYEKLPEYKMCEAFSSNIPVPSVPLTPSVREDGSLEKLRLKIAEQRELLEQHKAWKERLNTAPTELDSGF